MLKVHVEPLAEALNQMADAFDRKPLSEGATKVWFETLREFSIEMVVGFLKDWPKHHVKFTAPAELWKALNEVSIANREKASEDLRKQAQEPVRFAKTDAGRRALTEIRKLVQKPKPSPRAHWEKVLATHRPQSIGHDYAKVALAGMSFRSAREPGQDDE